MVTTEAHFRDIRNVIINELSMAKQSVYVAVAWFTDNKLFDTLIMIQEKGVHVQVCVIRDEINFGMGSLPFERLKIKNGHFFTTPNDKMHHKFCVIDESVVISGSYNWTKRAAAGKEENIIITSGDLELSQQFIKEFLKITKQQSPYFAEINIAKIINRCTVILQLIQLDDTEDIHKHALRLQNEAGDMEEVKLITKYLLQNEFLRATENINELLAKYRTVKIYNDPLIDELLFEIKIVKYQIIAVEYEKKDIEQILFEYDRLYNAILGEVVKQYLFTKKQWAKINAAKQPKSQINQEAYQEAESDYENFNNTYEETKTQTKNFKEISKEDKALLKKLYREACVLCHPDKFDNEPEKYVKAASIFKELNEANRNQDIESVKTILQHLKNGYFDFENTNKQRNSIVELKAELLNLQQKLKLLLFEIDEIKEGKAYQITSEQVDLHNYFKTLKVEIETETANLKAKLEEYEYQ